MYVLLVDLWVTCFIEGIREVYGFKRCETMEDINSDPEITTLLRILYTHPDIVELYLALFIENVEPGMVTGCALPTIFYEARHFIRCCYFGSTQW